MPDHRTLGVLVTLAAAVLVLTAAAVSWRFLERPLIEEGRKARY